MEERVSAESVTDLRTAKFGIQKRELRNMSLSTRTFGIPLKTVQTAVSNFCGKGDRR